jgi:hypothetical protein
MRVFPNETVTRNYKIKENHIISKIKDKFPDLTWTCDKRYDFAPISCSSLRRPDMYCHFGCYVLIIEVDENQHTGYDTICENKRLCELYQDFGRKLVFIRFNPDEYINIDGLKVESCFDYDKNGICHIQRNKYEDFNRRLEILYRHINEYTNIHSEKIMKEITHIHLFYDSPTTITSNITSPASY